MLTKIRIKLNKNHEYRIKHTDRLYIAKKSDFTFNAKL